LKFFLIFREQLFKNIEKAELQIPKFVSDDAANLLRAVKIIILEIIFFNF
jgi:hypothetical protein